MPWWVWVGGLILFAIVGFSLFLAFRNPEFVFRFFRSVAWAIFNALLPVLLKRKTEEEEKQWRDAVRRGEEWDEFRNQPRRR